MAQLRSVSFDPISVVTIANTAVNALGELLKSIPLLGGIFKGSTPHIPFDTAVEKSNAVAAECMKVYNALDSVGQQKFHEGARNYYLGYVKANFGSWWDNAINNDYETWEAKGWRYDQGTETYHMIAQPVFYFLRFEDATRIEETFAQRFTFPITTMMWKPISDYIQSRYNTTLDKFKAELTLPPPSEAGILSSDNVRTLIFVGIIVGGIFLASKFMKKK